MVVSYLLIPFLLLRPCVTDFADVTETISSLPGLFQEKLKAVQDTKESLDKSGVTGAVGSMIEGAASSAVGIGKAVGNRVTGADYTEDKPHVISIGVGSGKDKSHVSPVTTTKSPVTTKMTTTPEPRRHFEPSEGMKWNVSRETVVLVAVITASVIVLLCTVLIAIYFIRKAREKTRAEEQINFMLSNVQQQGSEAPLQ